MSMLCFNGQFLDDAAPLFTAANRGFRYGQGLFETMKLFRGEVLFFPLHLERLQRGMQMLHINNSSFSADQIRAEIRELCAQNNCSDRARIRWAVYAGEDGQAAYVLEAQPLEESVFTWNEAGWTLSLYSDHPKATGALSNLKSANYLLYLLAARHALQCGTDESLVLNTEGSLCDGSRTNVFILHRGMLKTPALNQGCVAGVMRRYLLQECARMGIPVEEGLLTGADLADAEEVFLTNAIQGIRWVAQYAGNTYGNSFSSHLFRQTLATIYR